MPPPQVYSCVHSPQKFGILEKIFCDYYYILIIEIIMMILLLLFIITTQQQQTNNKKKKKKKRQDHYVIRSVFPIIQADGAFFLR